MKGSQGLLRPQMGLQYPRLPQLCELALMHGSLPQVQPRI
jgi:hypothetical protein